MKRITKMVRLFITVILILNLNFVLAAEAETKIDVMLSAAGTVPEIYADTVSPAVVITSPTSKSSVTVTRSSRNFSAI